jgi:aminoglycoside 3-N-acetyltransferase I
MGKARGWKMMPVRRLGHDDAELAAAALRALKPADELLDERVDPDSARRFLTSPQNILLVATSGSQPVGYAVAHELSRVDRPRPMILLYEIAVARTHQRQGIAGAMLLHLKEIARQRGARKMWVLTDESNVPARRLYASGGAGTVRTNLLFEWEAGEL